MLVHSSQSYSKEFKYRSESSLLDTNLSILIFYQKMKFEALEKEHIDEYIQEINQLLRNCERKT